MSIILDDDPDINDQELDAQQQVFSCYPIPLSRLLFSDILAQDLAESAAEILYGLVHSRFIITNRGLELMAEKFRQVRFGTCPRMQCNRQPLLPIGQSDNPQQSNVRLYCGKCNDIFLTEPKSCSLDGAYFGTTFPHMFFMQYPDLKPERIDGNGKLYVPRIFGFRVHDPTETDDERALRRSLYVPPPQAQDDSGSN
jgi:casein kinase II subunit beta